MRMGPRNIQFVRTPNQHSFGTQCILRRKDGVLCVQLCKPLLNNFSRLTKKLDEEKKLMCMVLVVCFVIS